ncbi:ABC transporter ATP-binding protein [Corynebacterium bovis]|uniref:Energy-coupling factor transport system ATP-binding protein n=4 Tax=Corynebacterium bovis TaxID=36808 RepID=A0A8H9Y9V4_9CORY|nr:ABC transporter ATP-binding protein [Corynebacterium bovis]MBB3116003.1 energy-coupling factor transport system ATP-binding protein [Corynebacterium bovis DSM 20582 = CIP 54.80]QQC46945.1 ABC transporter ATP-binding protein [Corynebacterium bovis]RRQ13971.1 ABC transporter ATP-binding protein [Corynebacterium bovis]WJY76593.1 Putative HMP/thiamine import ATP-binding protein YkoD [Corynebacterium bovis DSM 20582 = CIP 54.80]
MTTDPAPATPTGPVVDVRGLTLTTDPGGEELHGDAPRVEPVVLLDDVTFRVEPGETVLVTGHSGAGKSSLLRVLNGLVPHVYPGRVTGHVEVGGVDPSTADLAAAGRTAATVFQNPRTQFFATDVLSEIAFGVSNAELPRDEILTRVDDAAHRFDLTGLLDRGMAELSGGERQRVALASAVVSRPRLYLLDEPTANLDAAGTRHFTEAVRHVRAAGATVVIAEHRMHHLVGVVDRVVQMEGGRIVRDRPADEFWVMSAAERAAGGFRAFDEPAEDALPPVPVPVGGGGDGDGDGGGDGLTVEDLAVRRAGPGRRRRWGLGRAGRSGGGRGGDGDLLWSIPAARFPRGAVTCVTGRNGAGKSTLLRVLVGLQKADGVIRLDGEELSPRRRRAVCSAVMQDVNRQLFGESVDDELQLSVRGARAVHARGDAPGGQAGEPEGRPAGGPADDHANEPAGGPDDAVPGGGELLGSLGLAGMGDRHPLSLSGGQRQRLAVATARIAGSDVIVFDEPTSGLDLGAMEQMAAVIRSCADRGAVVILVTHDRELMERVGDHELRVGAE